jgi:hypothetical protein
MAADNFFRAQTESIVGPDFANQVFTVSSAYQ